MLGMVPDSCRVPQGLGLCHNASTFRAGMDKPGWVFGVNNTARDAEQVPGTLVPVSPEQMEGCSCTDSLGPTQLGVLRLEQIELLGEEHRHHEEQEQDEGG